MKFRNLTKFKFEQLTLALKENDAAEIERLRKKKDRFLMERVLYADFKKISPEIVEIFANRFTDENWQAWGMKAGSRGLVVSTLMHTTLAHGREDLFPVFINSGIDFTGENGTRALQGIIEGVSPAKAAAFAAAVLEKGFNRTQDMRPLAEQAIKAGQTGVFDLLVAAGNIDIHFNNEEMLRSAGTAQQDAMARHLVEKHGADLTLAVTTARTLGHESSWTPLAKLHGELRPEEDTAPPTIESLSAELKLLKQTVRELTEEVRVLRGPQLNKPVLSRPTGP